MLFASAACLAHAQSAYPAKPITMYVGFAAGSATDIVARVVGQKLSERLGQPVVVQSLTGAASTLATAAVARASPDGYTLMTVSGALAIGPAVYSNLKFDVEKDLTPIGLVGSLPTVLLVNESLGVNSFSAFVEQARKRPGQLNYGSSGNGGSTHLSAELLSHTLGIKMTHVPYRGNAPAASALMAGEVQVLMDTVMLASQSVKTNRVRALAVTGKTRSPVLPDVPTFAEVGLPNFDASIFFGIMGPAKLAPDIVEKLNRELNEVLKDPGVKSTLVSGGGLQLSGGTPEQMGQLVHTEVAKWKRVSQQAGIKAE
ncbi:tripartite tricarboxylate transporter substrate binding protein [Acidovorax sp. Be4]|uniref:Tripartite tricarboxylate transporter substrate binding protein n=1 Tax=Acidovorax bellezanensis TaxID=2976702 RepID=A0ABT2PLH4_9BURK|nr:tripartite tricarboxylate transporter substrate binding protein [Acidovorax sp. Be4]MCT9810694.1 tripartite tricarboxylate transporter substrate binding protein [Acidovorax sp. Be4]